MTATEAPALILALERRISERDAAIRSGADVADAGPAAQELVTFLAGHGWGPVPADPRADWRTKGTGGGLPSAKEAREALAAAREACAVSPTRVHPPSDDDQLGETG